MKITKEGSVLVNWEMVLTCDHCTTEFQVEQQDIQSIKGRYDEPDYHFVKCPVCQKQRFLEEEELPLRWKHSWLNAFSR